MQCAPQRAFVERVQSEAQPDHGTALPPALGAELLMCALRASMG